MSSVHVVSFIAGRTELWLSPDGSPAVDGFCIGRGDSYEAALRDARRDLERALERVRALQVGADATDTKKASA